MSAPSRSAKNTGLLRLGTVGLSHVITNNAGNAGAWDLFLNPILSLCR
jgi:hypothetical protein